MPLTRKVTGADVAAAAGVSRATVSYVLNNTAGQSIPEDTRARVRAAAEEVGYVPHMAGRALRRGHSDLVVLILPDWPMGSVIGEMIDQLSAAAAERNLTLTILRRTQGMDALASAIRTLAPAALITLDTLPEAIVRVADAHRILIVPALHTLDEPRTDISLAQQHVGALQVEHLVSRGHRKLGVLSPADTRVNVFADGRFHGVQSACQRHGLAQPLRAVLPLNLPALTAAALEWTQHGVTAVCAYNDEWAMGLLSSLHAAGLSAPRDLAVIGCDDIPIAVVASPPLTTIRQNMRLHAAQTMNFVLQHLDRAVEQPLPGLRMCELVVRESA